MAKVVKSKTGGKTPPKGKPFSSKNQPSGKAKSAGWERKREAQNMLDDIMRKQGMKYTDFLKKYFDKKVKYKKVDEVQKDGTTRAKAEEVVKYEPKESLTIRERYIALYVYEAISKGSPDWMNRHISFAPQKTELTGEDGGAIEVISQEDDDKVTMLLLGNM